MSESDMAACIHGKPLSEKCSECDAQASAPEVYHPQKYMSNGEPTPPSHPMRYDIATDETVPVTQADWDEAIDFIHKAIEVKSALAEPDPESSPPWKFQLAVFPNPMRPGEAFVTEAKTIEPYDQLKYKGETYFPPVPKTEWAIPSSISVGFASEIVRRWNRVPGQY